MESVHSIPVTLRQIPDSLILKSFEKFHNPKSNLNVSDPKSIFGKVSAHLTNNKKSTWEERRYLHLLWQNSIKVNFWN